MCIDAETVSGSRVVADAGSPLRSAEDPELSFGRADLDLADDVLDALLYFILTRLLCHEEGRDRRVR